MFYKKLASPFQRLAHVPQNPTARSRVHMQFRCGHTLAPSLVRARGHPMNELRGLYLLELGLALGLRVVADDHLGGQPRGDHAARVDVCLP